MAKYKVINGVVEEIVEGATKAAGEVTENVAKAATKNVDDAIKISRGEALRRKFAEKGMTVTTDHIGGKTSTLLSDAEKKLSDEQMKDLIKLRNDNARRINRRNVEGASGGKVYELNRTGHTLTSRAKNQIDDNGNIVGNLVEKPGYSGNKVNRNSINGFQDTMEWQGREMMKADDTLFASMSDKQWEKISAGQKKTKAYNRSDTVGTTPKNTSAAKVSASDPKGKGNNWVYKTAAGGVGGYMVFNMFDSKGQQSNSQLYGQY